MDLRWLLADLHFQLWRAYFKFFGQPQYGIKVHHFGERCYLPFFVFPFAIYEFIGIHFVDTPGFGSDIGHAAPALQVVQCSAGGTLLPWGLWVSLLAPSAFASAGVNAVSAAIPWYLCRMPDWGRSVQVQPLLLQFVLRVLFQLLCAANGVRFLSARLRRILVGLLDELEGSIFPIGQGWQFISSDFHLNIVSVIWYIPIRF